MLLGTSRNGRLEVSQYSVSTTSGAVSVIRRDAKRNTSRLTTPGSLNTWLMCEGQRWIFNVLTILFWYTGSPSFRPRSEKLNNFRVRSLLKTFCHLTQLESKETFFAFLADSVRERSVFTKSRARRRLMHKISIKSEWVAEMSRGAG